MRRVAAQLAAARHAAGCVLFTGEAGSGREHLARVLHARRPHGKRAFVPVDCQRASSTELKRLLKHLADDREEVEALRMGTLFLKNIASAARDVQDRLAEWLAAVAGDQGPRIMAATDCSLQELTERDEFHRELYFLLTTFVIEVPPLRKRSQDVLPLAQYFLEEGNRAAEKQLSGFSPDAMDALRRYYWPGNVAELREVVRAAAASAAGPLVTESDLPLAFRVGQENQRIGPPPAKPLLPLEATLEQVEREQIQAALAACRNNLSKAANLLGVSRPKLYRRLEALGLLPDAKET
jgi:DNA-binding NtrC family response regulator